MGKIHDCEKLTTTEEKQAYLAGAFLGGGTVEPSAKRLSSGDGDPVVGICRRNMQSHAGALSAS